MLAGLSSHKRSCARWVHKEGSNEWVPVGSARALDQLPVVDGGPSAGRATGLRVNAGLLMQAKLLNCIDSVNDSVQAGAPALPQLVQPSLPALTAPDLGLKLGRVPQRFPRELLRSSELRIRACVAGSDYRKALSESNDQPLPSSRPLLALGKYDDELRHVELTAEEASPSDSQEPSPRYQRLPLKACASTLGEQMNEAKLGPAAQVCFGEYSDCGPLI